MCNNCNCENYLKCSIVGFMPIGFCCSHCVLYNEEHTCLLTKSHHAKAISSDVKGEKITPVSTSIEGGLLKVVIEQGGEEIPIYIDLQKHLNGI